MNLPRVLAKTAPLTAYTWIASWWLRDATTEDWRPIPAILTGFAMLWITIWWLQPQIGERDNND